MKIFIDTADIKEISKYVEWGVIDGVTTNPTSIARVGNEARQVIQAICQEVPAQPVLAEVLSLEASGMAEEGRRMSQWNPNVVIKIPICEEGLKAVKMLSAEQISTAVTLIFTPGQALLAAKAGADYICPFVGRLEDTGGDGLKLVDDIVNIYSAYLDIDTEVLVASVRTPQHVVGVASMGAPIATLPPKVLQQLLAHPLTERGIALFMEDAQKAALKL